MSGVNERVLKYSNHAVTQSAFKSREYNARGHQKICGNQKFMILFSKCVIA